MTEIICPHDDKETPIEHCIKQRWSPAPVVGSDLWPQCRGCKVDFERPPETITEIKDAPMLPSNVFSKLKPHQMWTGSKCGHTRRRDEFYESDPGTCKACRKVQDAQRKTKKQVELKVINPPVKTFKDTQAFEPWTGAVCGHSKLKKDFYASNSGTCIACYRDAYRENVKKKQEETKMKAEVAMEKPEIVEQMPVADLKPETPCCKSSAEITEMKVVHTCHIHGEHEGTMIGGKRNTSCPTCSEEKRLKAYRDMLKKKIVLDFASWPWLLTWVRDEAGGKGISPEKFIEQSLILAVPEKELKRLILENRA